MDEDDVFSVEVNDPYVPLDSADSEYIRGIEVGILLQNCIFNYGSHMKVHTSNIEQIMRLAGAFDYSFYSEDVDEDDMVILTMIPSSCGCGDEECESVNEEEDD